MIPLGLMLVVVGFLGAKAADDRIPYTRPNALMRGFAVMGWIGAIVAIAGIANGLLP